jgi:hypothetical protein
MPHWETHACRRFLHHTRSTRSRDRPVGHGDTASFKCWVMPSYGWRAASRKHRQGSSASEPAELGAARPAPGPWASGKPSDHRACSTSFMAWTRWWTSLARRCRGAGDDDNKQHSASCRAQKQHQQRPCQQKHSTSGSPTQE